MVKCKAMPNGFWVKNSNLMKLFPYEILHKKKFNSSICTRIPQNMFPLIFKKE